MEIDRNACFISCACGRFILFTHYVSGEAVCTSPPSTLHSIAFSSFHPPQHRTA
ncbi:MAG: hypothetical protein P4L34_10320 [Paludibacter sp.]|nr:hypothetical protein [Paludibacter sp.]